MFFLKDIYSKRTYDTFTRYVEAKPVDSRMLDLSGTRQSASSVQDDHPWEIRSYRELVESTAFLGAMNKRHTLFFRGQGKDSPLWPSLFRDKWASPFVERQYYPIQSNIQEVWDFLNNTLVPQVREACFELGIPRWRGLAMFREAMWAIIQHYELWPTPLIDITPNLRVAASFALWNEREEGFLYVFGMPPSTDSITFDADQHIVLARLQAVCPPLAVRPHYQDGFLAGQFPLLGPKRDTFTTSNLGNRLIAKFKLCGGNSFWSHDFPGLSKNALLPEDDVLKIRFRELFGPTGAHSVDAAIQLMQMHAP